MAKLIEEIKRNLKVYIIAFIIGGAIGLTFTLVFYFVENKSFIGAINGLTWASIGVGMIGVLMLVGNFGAYDFMSYGFSQMFTSFFSKEPNKYNDYVEYQQAKKERRKSSPKYYISLFLVAIIFGIALAIVEIIFHIKY